MSVQVALKFKDPDGHHQVEDTTHHIWERPLNSTHLRETIALSLGVHFALGGTLTHPIEFGSIELVAFANLDNVMTAENVTMTALQVDEVDS